MNESESRLRGLPLPLDLASVAWLADHREENRGVGGWVSGARAWGFQTNAEYWQRRAHDMERVIRDQQRHIKQLEAELRPNLVKLMDADV